MGLPAHARVCRVDDCTRLVGRKGAKGLCPRHYQRMMSTGSPTGTRRPPAESRFFAKVVQDGECWRWRASTDQAGYGLFSVKRTRTPGHMIRAHIWSYEFSVGPVPDGLQLDHTCHDTSCGLGRDCPHRACVNPWHLDPVPPAVNTQRGRGQRRTHCPAGHRYDIANTYINTKGAQVCRTCMAASRARYEQKMRAA